MRWIGNILWFILGGVITGLTWCLLGLLLCITVVGIPFGLQCFKAANLSFAPFGKDVHIDFAEHPIANILWVILVGWEMALAYLAYGVIFCITIVGIPLGLQMFKFMKLALFPFGADIERM